MKDDVKNNVILVGASEVVRRLSNFFSFDLSCRPYRVDIRLTHECNLACRLCRQARGLKELNTQEWKAAILSFRKWLGRFPLVITGGEPLLRTDLFEISKFSHDLGLVTMLNSNGSLINKEVVDKLEGSGIDAVSLSLDGFKYQTHDYLRGEGTYEKTMNAIFCLKGRIRTQIKTVITKQNLDELIDLVEFSERNSLGISFQGLICKGYDGKNISDVSDNEFFPKDKDKISWQFNSIIERKKRSRYINNPLRYLRELKTYYLGLDNSVRSCRAHENLVTILPDGSVRVCWLLAPIGNISRMDINTIWRSEKARLIKREFKKCRLNCSFFSCFFQDSFFEKISRCWNIFFTR